VPPAPRSPIATLVNSSTADDDNNNNNCFSVVIVHFVAVCYIISPPENDSFRKDFCFTADVFYFFF